METNVHIASHKMIRKDFRESSPRLAVGVENIFELTDNSTRRSIHAVARLEYVVVL